MCSMARKKNKVFPPSNSWSGYTAAGPYKELIFMAKNKQWVASNCYCSQWSPSSWYNVLKRRIRIVSSVWWKLLKKFCWGRFAVIPKPLIIAESGVFYSLNNVLFVICMDKNRWQIIGLRMYSFGRESISWRASFKSHFNEPNQHWYLFQ